MRNKFNILLAVLLFSLLFLSAGQAMAATASPQEQKIKAAFMFNFLKFIEWPESEVSGKDDVITIGLVCDKNMFVVLESMIGKKVKGKKIVVERFESYRRFAVKDGSDRRQAYADRYSNKLDRCKMLYICASEGDYFEDILSIVGDRSMVTVGDADGFAAKGGTIGFIKRDKKLCFEINVKSAKKARVRISSKLLSLAKRIFDNDTVSVVMNLEVSQYWY